MFNVKHVDKSKPFTWCMQMTQKGAKFVYLVDKCKEIMNLITYICIGGLKKGAIPVAHLYHVLMSNPPGQDQAVYKWNLPFVLINKLGIDHCLYRGITCCVF